MGDWFDFNRADDPITRRAPNDSADVVKGRLLDRLPQVLSHLFPNGKTRGQQFFIGDVDGNTGKSLVVELAGDKTGMWIDFSTDESGDILDLWARSQGLDVRRDFADMMEAIEQWLGIAPALPSTPSPPQPPTDDLGPRTGKWDYIDAEGNLIACVYRYDPPSGKEFRPWDVKTRKTKAPDPRPLYNQMGIAKATHIVLVEGEKAADALIQSGTTATTAMNGAKAPIDKTDWSPLNNKHVAIWPDNDEVGREYAHNAVSAILQAGALSCAIVSIPSDKPEKWDAFDAVEEGIHLDSFIKNNLPDDEPIQPTGVQLRDWTAVKFAGRAPEQQFLVNDTIPLGSVTILAAMGDTGKGMMTLSLALDVATGGALLDFHRAAFGNTVNAFGTAVIFTAEDDLAEVHRRLERLDPVEKRLVNPERLIIVPLPNAGGPLPLVTSNKDGAASTDEFANIRQQLLSIEDLKLVVFDPLASFIHADVNADPSIGSFTTGLLAGLATETGAAVMVAHHMRKPPTGKAIVTPEQAREAIRGTSALVDGVRSAYCLWPVADEQQDALFTQLKLPPKKNGLYWGAIVKSNGPADRHRKTYWRNDAGLLCDVSVELISQSLPLEEQLDSLRFAVARAAKEGHPYTHTGGTGIFKQRHRLPTTFHHLSRHKIEKHIQTLLNHRPPRLVKGKASGSKEDKWLDIPTGPFALGVGEFKHGADTSIGH